MLWRLIRPLVHGLTAIPIRRRLTAFETATRRLRQVQEQLLRRILSAQARTAFGRRHHFRSITTIADFRRQLPVATYEYFEPYIQRVARGEHQALLADARVHMFAMTSGTTAARKFIPVTGQYLADYKRGWNLWGV